MTGREWLYRAFKIEIKIRELKFELKEAQNNSMYLSPSFGEKVQYTHGNSAETKNIQAIVQNEKLQQDLRNKIAEKEQVLIEVAAAIEQITDPIVKEVLRARYISCKSIELIAVEQGYVYRNVQKILRKGEEFIEIHIANKI